MADKYVKSWSVEKDIYTSSGQFVGTITYGYGAKGGKLKPHPYVVLFAAASQSTITFADPEEFHSIIAEFERMDKALRADTADD